MPPISPETFVGIDAGRNIQEGQIDRECDQPRSYDVVTARSNFQRNRRDTIPVPSNSSHQNISEPYVTRYGRSVKPPQRYPH